MTDIFDSKILCKNCNVEMEKQTVSREGFHLRAVRCPKCGERIIHPADEAKLNQMKDLKGKTFNVKLRMVGNSHAISIPKEIVDFMHENQREMKRHMDDMVRLCFKDFGKLSLNFGLFDNIDGKIRKKEHEDREVWR